MVPKLLIRHVLSSEIGALVALCAEHAAFERAEYSPRGQAERLVEAIFSEHPRLWCLVATVDDHMVGYATCSREFSTWHAADFLHMDCLYLQPAYRGRGIGWEMMRAVARQARDLGCAFIEWQTPVWNESGARFYRKLGAAGNEKTRFRWSGQSPHGRECS